jgi:N-acetylglucosamine-6-sulfatase
LKGLYVIRISAAVVVAALLLALPLACGGGGETVTAGRPDGAGTVPEGGPTGAGSGGPSDPPNVILILADDLDRAVFEESTLAPFWEPAGTSFTNALATTSLCCPSRASILRGQYAHNTGLVDNNNDRPGGGARFFRESGLEETTLATMLQSGGYETWFGGKYLNGYDHTTRVPPGWDRWQAYLNAEINVDGRRIPYGDEHYTDWLANRAAGYIENRDAAEGPFFMQVSALDTHEPLKVPSRHAGAFADAGVPRTPSYDEADVSDKPAWVRENGPLKPEEVYRFDERHAARLRSALTLTDLSRRVMSALSSAGHLEDTYVIFTSDNGYHMGLHRLRAPKWTPYTEAHEVPFVVSGADVARQRSFDHLVSNTDIAPTVLDLTGLQVPDWMDGRSFAPFFDGTAPENWRHSLLIEGAGDGDYGRPNYAGVRREDDTYVEYANGEREYYDLAEDPHQLENRPEDAPRGISEDLDALEGCSGDACRRAEGF